MRVIMIGLALLSGCAVPANTIGYAPDGGSEAEARPIAIAMRLKEGDQVRVHAPGADHLSGIYVVGNDGLIALPGGIWAPGRGLTIGELADTLEAIASIEGAPSPPNSIDVWLLDTDRIFYVLGEVQRPGAFAFRPGLTVLDAVASAGGATARAEDGWAYHKRDGAMGEVRRSLTGDPAVLQPGDIVRLAEMDEAAG